MIPDVATFLSLVITTVAQLMILWVAAGYRDAAIAIQAEKDRNLELMNTIVNEIDHRTKNNFMIASALLNAQARACADEGAAQELNLAASRLVAIAGTYKNLALRSESISQVRLHDHIRELCDTLREGMVPPGVFLRCTLDEMIVDSRVAVQVGLIVNEWIANAVKYAFYQGTGVIDVTLAKTPHGFVACVQDDGAGMDQPFKKGSGLHLTETLAKSIGAEISVDHKAGTRCTVDVPFP